MNDIHPRHVARAAGGDGSEARRIQQLSVFMKYLDADLVGLLSELAL